MRVVFLSAAILAAGLGLATPSSAQTKAAGAAAAPGALDALCLENIARFKRPRDYRFVEALPKNNYGKVLKTELRKRL